MSFSDLIKQKLFLLLPFSWPYKAGVYLFHKLYDCKFRSSYTPPVKTICVGNLSVGGTGKSPMVEYLVALLKNQKRVAVISRGYRRKTKGFVIANEKTTASDIGDEPMQFHTKFPDVSVAVDENRANAIRTVIEQKPGINVVILDDAFQHRAVTAGLNILLTAYNNIFPKDFCLPAGSLRDLKSNYKRAHIIVVTKCPGQMDDTRKQEIERSIKPLPHQLLFFTTLTYAAAYDITTHQPFDLANFDQLLLVTGIADPRPILAYLQKFTAKVARLTFKDHHNFSAKDIGDILGTYKLMGSGNKAILTTEKDAMRLSEHKELRTARVLALPIRHHFLFDEEQAFNNRILDYVKE